MPRAVEHVDARVRVAGMDEDLVVLLEPLVDAVPVEREQPLDVLTPVDRIQVAPHRVLDHPLADDEVPVRRFTFAGARRVLVGRLQEVGADVVTREVPDRAMVPLEQHQRGLGVDDGLVADEAPDPSRVGLGAHVGHGRILASPRRYSVPSTSRSRRTAVSSCFTSVFER